MSLNCAMVDFLNLRRLPPAGLLIALLFGAAVATGQSSGKAPSKSQESIPQQNGTPLPLKPDLPGMARNHRLILKDGTYQVVREYKLVGDRVRYLSQERGDWEELPANLVDWDATRKWEQAHAEPYEDQSPAMQEAAKVDQEENQARSISTGR